MTTEAMMAVAPIQISGLGDGSNINAASPALGVQPSDGSGPFGRLVNQGLESVNHDLVVSQTDLQELATGNVQNLHQIMIRMEETRLSFQLFMQVRNRLLEAYQDIMKMQV